MNARFIIFSHSQLRVRLMFGLSESAILKNAFVMDSLALSTTVAVCPTPRSFQSISKRDVSNFFMLPY